MDKNIANLLRPDARTVHVVFPYDNKGLGDGSGIPKKAASPNSRDEFVDRRPLYTYVTNLPLKPEDYVVVPARGQFAIAQVKEVDADCQIEPNSDIVYAWVVGAADIPAWDANNERNKQIEREVANAYRRGLKRSFRDKVLADLDPSESIRVLALLPKA